MSIHGPRLLGTQGRPGFGTLGAKTKKAPGKLGTVKVTVATNRGYSSELDRNHPCLPPTVSPMGTRTGIQRGNWTRGGSMVQANSTGMQDAGNRLLLGPKSHPNKQNQNQKK